MDRTDIDITERLSKDADLFALAGLGGDENDGELYGGVDFKTKEAAESDLLGDLHEAVTTIEAVRTNLADAVEEGTTKIAARDQSVLDLFSERDRALDILGAAEAKIAALQEEVRVLRGGNPPQQGHSAECGGQVAGSPCICGVGLPEPVKKATGYHDPWYGAGYPR